MSFLERNGIIARILTMHVARRQEQTFTDWFAELRELAGYGWPDVADQAPTVYAVWGGGATPQQLYMVGLILPVLIVNFIRLAQSRESGDAPSHGGYAKTYLVGGHWALQMALSHCRKKTRESCVSNIFKRPRPPRAARS